MAEISKEKLNQLGRDWCDPAKAADADEKQKLAAEIFIQMSRLFPQRQDAWGEFYLRDWPRFDAQKSELYSFMSRRLSFRMNDIGHADGGDHRKSKKENDEDGSWEYNLSLNASVNDEGTEHQDQLEDGDSWAEIDRRLQYDETVLSLLSLALCFPERLSGRAKNPQRLNYFRMFFTDSVVDILHQNLETRPFVAHERDLFHAIKLGFLDFFMQQVCRSVPEIKSCGVKHYGALVDGRPDAAPGHPLPNDVYMTYLNTVEGSTIKSPGTISNQRAEYERFMRENLC